MTTVDPIAIEQLRDPEVASAAPATTQRRRWPVLRVIGAVWLTLVVGSAILAPVLPLRDYAEGGLGVAEPPFSDRLLGTDQLGRDLLSRVVYGARTSLLISSLSVGFALVAGVSLGLIAGYYRGKVDAVISMVANIILAMPGIVFLMVIAALAGPSKRNLIAGIALFLFPTFLRLARANTIVYAQREFVLAAQGLGARSLRIAIREVLPNVMPAVLAYTFSALGLVFVVEGSLSFLGLGIQPPTPSWGSIISAGRQFLETDPHIVLVPAIVMFLTVLSLNLLAERGTRTAMLRPGREKPAALTVAQEL